MLPTKIRALSMCLIGLVSLLSAAASGQVTSERQYLSGTDKDNTVDWEFFCTAGAKSGNWTTIPVPSAWDVKGFGNLNYGGDKQPYEEGKYRHKFQVPANWTGRKTILVFDGVFTDTDARINGKSVGPVHQGGFYQFKYDVTDLIKVGAENTIEVDVKKRSDNAGVNEAERRPDFWIFGGIYRPVYLESVPAQYIERVAIDAKANGNFSAEVITPAGQTADAVDVDILDANGKSIATGTAKPGQRVTAKAPDVQTWTAETPNLYTAKFSLKSGGKVVHEMTKRFGFRTIEVRPGDGVYVNGTKIILKGVCRHAAWPDSGRTLTAKIDEFDIEMIKSMNMNAVRMSHYPPDESFLDLCDQLGLYVLDEETGWQHSYDAPTSIRLAGEVVRRDVNHPSILFWDNGNEGGWNTAADPEFAKWDPQHRAVLHPWAIHDNVNTKHYPTYTLLTQLLNGPDVFFPTEYLHGLYDGGAGAGMRDYWNAITSSPKGAGGFVWVYADEGLKREDGHIDVVGNAAPDGILGPYREKEGSYYTLREIFSPVILPQTLPPSFAGQLQVTNTYAFTSLKKLKFEWALLKYKGMDDSTPGHEVISKGEIVAPDIAPGRKGPLAIDLPADWKNADALAITILDWNGYDIVDKIYPLDTKHSYAPTPVAAAVKTPAAAGNGSLTSGDVTLAFDAKTGAIQSVTKAGKDLLFKGGPRLAMGKPVARGGGRRNNNAPPPPPAPEAQGKLVKADWSAGKDGWFCLIYTIQASGPVDYLGVTFDLPADSVKSAKWLGLGPYRVYQNRMEGGNVDVWERAYNATITGWTGFDYPEFKGYHADIRWATITTSAGKITIAPETKGLFLHILTPDLPPGDLARSAVAGYPDGQISVMHAISAIGSKFTVPQESGPQGQPFEAKGSYNGKVWFRFN